MSLYNAYSPSITSSLSASTAPTGTESHFSVSSKYPYKPPTYSSTLSSRYRSPTGYSSPSTYTSLTRTVSTSYLTSRVPRFDSVRSYSSAISSELKSSAALWRSPSSYLPGSTPITDSLPAYTSSKDTTPPYKVSSSLSCDKSDDAEDKREGRVGLNNLGNTCFMNAILQCLYHTQPLADYCVRGTYLSDVNHRSPTRGDLIKVFADFLKKISDSKCKSAISPQKLRTEVQRYAPRFSGDNQQDAQEFLRYLLQGLHDDINRVRYKPSRKESTGGDSLKTWRRYKETDDSLIVDLFAGQLKSTLKCTTCNNDSITYDPFWDLSLPIPEGCRNTSLRQCFSLFASPEFLDGTNKPYCEVCKKKARSSKKIVVNKLPKVLVIHLKRFSPTSHGQKLNMMIECPLMLGNLSELTSKNSISDSCPYALYGVVDHDGSNNSGHYIAKCRNLLTKEWNEFNDSRVMKTTTVVTNKSYILFYIQEGNFSL